MGAGRILPPLCPGRAGRSLTLSCMVFLQVLVFGTSLTLRGRKARKEAGDNAPSTAELVGKAPWRHGVFVLPLSGYVTVRQ